ncbi:hypothetical protein [Parasphingorhabdus sp.]|uniref:hypothetical protein n=1 Tax=Parasphingorhabdus sp. TaxID=2709688 RepID=UPI003A9146CC
MIGTTTPAPTLDGRLSSNPVAMVIRIFSRAATVAAPSFPVGIWRAVQVWSRLPYRCGRSSAPLLPSPGRRPMVVDPDFTTVFRDAIEKHLQWKAAVTPILDSLLADCWLIILIANYARLILLGEKNSSIP